MTHQNLNSSSVANISEACRQKITLPLILYHIVIHFTAGVPVIALLTKIDAISGHVRQDVSTVYHSSKIRDGISKTADLVGVPGGAVFPIYNYSSQTETDRNINLLAASLLLKVLKAADDRIRILESFEDSSDEDETEHWKQS